MRTVLASKADVDLTAKRCCFRGCRKNLFSLLSSLFTGMNSQIRALLIPFQIKLTAPFFRRSSVFGLGATGCHELVPQPSRVAFLM